MSSKSNKPSKQKDATRRVSDASVTAEFLEGAKQCIPVLVVASPFGAIFGATAIANGLSWQEAVFASAIMYAGASQFVFVEIHNLQLSAFSIMIAVFAVNFRHILYSASIADKLGLFSFKQKLFAFFLLTDPQYATCELRHETQDVRPSFYYGYGIMFYVSWVISTILGVYFGSYITDPAAFGFDFMIPMYFLTLLMGFRARNNFYYIAVVSGLSSFLLFKLIGPPWHITLGALCGIITAALMPIKQDAAQNSKSTKLNEEGGND